MYAGIDVSAGLEEARSQGKIRNNIFGTGLYGGVTATRGCSIKGKFWARDSVDDLNAWMAWCRTVGSLVTDVSINADDVFRGAMIPRKISTYTELHSRTAVAVDLH